MEKKAERGAREAAATAAPVLRHFPPVSYVDVTAIDFKKVAPKFLENNAALAASATPGEAAQALTPTELEAWAAMVAVLEQVTRYHATTAPRAGVALLAGRLRAWPLARQLPAADALRALALHADGAEALAERGDLVPGELARLAACGAAADLRPVALTSLRVLLNAFRHPVLRAQAGAHAPALVGAAARAMAHPHASVQAAAAALLYNVACLLAAQRRAAAAEALAARAAGAAPRARAADADPAVARLVAAAAIDGLAALADEEPLLRLVAALGTAAVLDGGAAAAARDAGAESALAAALAKVPASQALLEAAAEVRSVLPRGS